MARNAGAREAVFALRREIARIEGTLPERFDAPAASGSVMVRRSGAAVDDACLRTGIGRFDAVLGGGLARAALTEIHGVETRDAGAVAGFAMALCSLLLNGKEASAPVLWIGTAEIFREAGFPHAAGLLGLFGIAPDMLLFCEAPKLADALWVAEEAAPLTALSAVVLEVRGNSERLDLTATRRLHRRAQAGGRPVFLLRQAAWAESTAAPVRLVVSPSPASRRVTVAGPLDGSIGRPAFTVAIGKCAAALPSQFILEWNPDEHEFAERGVEKGGAKDTVAVVSLPGDGKGPAAAPGAVVAFRQAEPRSPRRRPAGEERAAHLGARRAG